VADPLESLPLLLIEGMVRIIRAGEVAHDLPDVQRVDTGRVGEQGLGLRRVESQTAHPGIEMDGAGQVRCQRAQVFQLLQVVDDREKRELAQLGQFRRPEAVEDEDVGRSSGQGFACFARFGGMGDIETAAPRISKRGNDLRRAEAIAIGLHHGADTGGGGERLQGRVITLDGGEINDQPWGRMGPAGRRPGITHAGRQSAFPDR
jgi:hypothetical protein